MTTTAALTVLAIGDSTRSLWWLSLGLGLVVLLAVLALLTILLRTVISVDEGVVEVWAAAKRLAANTSTTWMLRDTADALEAVKAEALQHDRMLEERL